MQAPAQLPLRFEDEMLERDSITREVKITIASSFSLLLLHFNPSNISTMAGIKHCTNKGPISCHTQSFYLPSSIS